MKKLFLIGADEGSFDYNRNFDHSKVEKREVEIRLQVEMVFKKGVDIVTFRIFVRYSLGKEQLLDYNTTLGFKVIGWSEYVEPMKDEEILNTAEVHRMLAVSVGFLRGSLSLQERSTPFKGAFLPLIDIEALKKNVIINRLPVDI